MSEEVAEVQQGEVSILSGVEGGESVNTDPNPSTPTEGTWFEGMSPEEIGYLQNKGFDGDDGTKKLFESYRNLERLRGVPDDQILKLPKDGDPMDDVYNKLGRPEKPEDYVYNPVEGEDVDSNPIIGDIRQAAHEAGLSAEGFTKLTDAYNQAVVREQQAMAEQAKEAEEQELSALKREYGADLDKMVDQSNATAIALGFDQDIADSLRNAMGPRKMLDLMKTLGDAVGEDTVRTSANKAPYGQTKEQLSARKAEIMAEINADATRRDAYLKNAGNDYREIQGINEALHAG
jgi:hypothetical protein